MVSLRLPTPQPLARNHALGQSGLWSTPDHGSNGAIPFGLIADARSGTSHRRIAATIRDPSVRRAVRELPASVTKGATSMTMRTTLLAAAIFATPFMAFAQSNNPTGNLGSNSSTTATPSTANSPSSGLHTGDANARPKPVSGAAMNPRVPGATGQTVVPGTSSSIAGDRPATANSKTGGAAGSGK
jgi:hypothetical protein